MRTEKKLWRPEGPSFPIAAILVFLLGVGSVLLLSIRSDLAEAEEHLLSVVSYASEQCTSYSMMSTASETRGLMRVMEEARQVAPELAYPEQAPDEALLRDCARNHYLSGLLLLDGDGEIAAACASHEEEIGLLMSELGKEALRETARYPKKTYAGRVYCPDGSYIDMAAHGRYDAEGVVVAYYRTPVEYIRTYGLLFTTLLDSYQTNREETLVVTDGRKVIASSDSSLVGLDSDETPVLRNLTRRGRNDEMLTVRSDDGETPHRSLGMVRRGRTYYVYAYMPERNIFGNTVQNAAMALFFYAVVLMLVMTLRWKTAQSYQARRLRQEREYQEKLMEAARRAERANAAKTEFLQRMSHDIRTPINGIQGMVAIGDHYSGDLQKQAECRQKIRVSAQLLLELVNEVLDMGKLEAGEVTLEERPFDLIELLDAVNTSLEYAAKERGVRVLRAPRRLTHTALVGSPVHLKRILMNILSNAVKYNRENGTVSLACRELRCEGNTAWFEFVCADTGIGMSEEYQKHIFEPFTQELVDARSSYSGTGLGMSIAKGLIDRMGGTIEFESRSGVGTTFRIALPFRVDCEEAPSAALTADEAEEMPLRGMRVLVAEDNALNMEIAEFLLRSAGAEPVNASDGREAVERFRTSAEGSFDAVLMDMMMPGLDGCEATRAIRAMERPDAKTVPILAMTAQAFAEDRRRAQEAGMNDYLTKPLDAATLVRALHVWRKK